MRRYKSRNGVVLTQVCGEQLLVSSRLLRELCPFVTVVNGTSAFLWKHLKDGATVEDLTQAVIREYEVEDPAAIRGLIESFLQQMMELNYVIAEEQGEYHEE